LGGTAEGLPVSRSGEGGKAFGFGGDQTSGAKGVVRKRRRMAVGGSTEGGGEIKGGDKGRDGWGKGRIQGRGEGGV